MSFFKKLIFLFAMSHANAAIMVTPLVVDFQTTESKNQSIKITNPSDHKTYIETTMLQGELIDGAYQYKKNVTKQLRAKGLLVTPKKFAIPPHKSRKVRLSLLKRPKKQDEVYALSLIPQKGDILTRTEGGKKVNMGVTISVGYQIRVIARTSAEPSYDVRLVRQDKTLTISNFSNTTVHLKKGQQCIDETCTPLKRKRMRLHPGMVETVKLQNAAPATYLLIGENGYTKEISAN